MIGTLKAASDPKPLAVSSVVEPTAEGLTAAFLDAEMTVLDCLGDLEAAEAVLSAIAAAGPLENPKVLVGISSVMTWARTSQDADEPEKALTEADYKKRRPHSSYKDLAVAREARHEERARASLARGACFPQPPAPAPFVCACARSRPATSVSACLTPPHADGRRSDVSPGGSRALAPPPSPPPLSPRRPLCDRRSPRASRMVPRRSSSTRSSRRREPPAAAAQHARGWLQHPADGAHRRPVQRGVQAPGDGDRTVSPCARCPGRRGAAADPRRHRRRAEQGARHGRGQGAALARGAPPPQGL